MGIERKEILGVSYEFVLGCDAFMNEKSSISGLVWAREDGGNGVAYGGCPGNAKWDVAPVDDYGAAVSVAQCKSHQTSPASIDLRYNTFSSPRPDIYDERHFAQSPIDKRLRDEQTVAEISMDPRCLPQTSLVFDLRSEERIRHDVPVRGIRAKL